MLNKGTIPLESFLSKLATDDFKGAVSVKINPKYLQVKDLDKMKSNLEDSIKFIQKYAKP